MAKDLHLMIALSHYKFFDLLNCFGHSPFITVGLMLISMNDFNPYCWVIPTSDCTSRIVVEFILGINGFILEPNEGCVTGEEKTNTITLLCSTFTAGI